MKTVFWLPPLSALLLLLPSCVDNNSGPGGSYGPFDSAGNYREDWADDPSKWRKPGSHSTPSHKEDTLPTIAKNDEPPPNANPLAPSGTSLPKTTSKPTSTPRESTSRVTSKPKTSPRETVVASRSKSSATKSKSTASKSKTKPKSSRYVVKKGDSLSAIASRNGSSVSAIQKANGISGTLIRPGQSLVIPKR